MASSVLLGYLGEPEETGAAVAFLASPGARYVTGHAIVGGGGQILPESQDALKKIWIQSFNSNTQHFVHVLR